MGWEVGVGDKNLVGSSLLVGNFSRWDGEMGKFSTGFPPVGKPLLPYPYNWQKFNNIMNEKRSQEYQSMDPKYVTGKINSHILELILRQFCHMIFAPS